MLKIRDGIDLKELEKFGFEKDDGYYFKYLFTKPCDSYEITYTIFEDVRLIKINTYQMTQEIDNTLYDLIKADLVEEVSNE